MATYSIVAVARTPAQLTGPNLVELGPLAGNIDYTDVLREAGDASVAVGVDTLQDDIKERLRDLVTYPTEVWVYRDGDLIFAGPIIGGAVQDSTVTLDIRSLDIYAAFMVASTDKAWTATDVSTIYKTVIDEWQALDYGDYGIDTSTTGLSGLTRTLTLPAAEEPISVYDFMVEQATDFDFWVDPDTRKLEVDTAKGSDLTASVFLERGVVSPAVRFAASPSVIGSEVVAIGTGPNLDDPITTTKSNTGVRSTFGRSGIVISADPVEDATHLGEIAQAVIDERGETLFIPGPGLIPVAGADVDDFAVGDSVTYTFDAGLGQSTGSYRIVKRTISVSESGQETMTVEFGAVPTY